MTKTKPPIGPTIGDNDYGFPSNPAERLRNGSVPTRTFPTVTISRPLGRCVEEYQITEVPYDESIESPEEEMQEHMDNPKTHKGDMKSGY